MAGGGAEGDAPVSRAITLGLPCGQAQPPKQFSQFRDRTNHGGVQRAALDHSLVTGGAQSHLLQACPPVVSQVQCRSHTVSRVYALFMSWMTRYATNHDSQLIDLRPFCSVQAAVVTRTSLSLLDRLKVARADASDWNQFEAIYRPLIRRWIGQIPGLGPRSTTWSRRSCWSWFARFPDSSGND